MEVDGCDGPVRVRCRPWVQWWCGGEACVSGEIVMASQPGRFSMGDRVCQIRVLNVHGLMRAEGGTRGHELPGVHRVGRGIGLLCCASLCGVVFSLLLFLTPYIDTP